MISRCVVWVARYKRQGGLNVYWQTVSVLEVGVDMAAVTVHSLRPDTTYRFRVMWRDDRNAHFSEVAVARTAGNDCYICLTLKRCSHCAHLTRAMDALTHDVGRHRTTSYDIVRSSDVVRCRAQCEQRFRRPLPWVQLQSILCQTGFSRHL